MKAKKVTAWACGRCNTPYTKKSVADTCCICIKCNTSVTDYSGHSYKCNRCHLEEAVEHNRREVLRTSRLLQQQEKDLKDLPPRVGG